MIARWTRFALLAGSVVVLTLGGCALDKTDIQDRIAAFIEDANEGRHSSLYEHLHSDCGDRNAAKNATFWDDTPFDPDYKTPTSFSLSGMTYGTTSSGMLNSSQPDDPITFVMKEEDEDDWYILSISTTSHPNFVQ
jgi:hypothetical protein